MDPRPSARTKVPVIALDDPDPDPDPARRMSDAGQVVDERSATAPA